MQQLVAITCPPPLHFIHTRRLLFSRPHTVQLLNHTLRQSTLQSHRHRQSLAPCLGQLFACLHIHKSPGYPLQFSALCHLFASIFTGFHSHFHKPPRVAAFFHVLPILSPNCIYILVRPRAAARPFYCILVLFLLQLPFHMACCMAKYENKVFITVN